MFGSQYRYTRGCIFFYWLPVMIHELSYWDGVPKSLTKQTTQKKTEYCEMLFENVANALRVIGGASTLEVSALFNKGGDIVTVAVRFFYDEGELKCLIGGYDEASIPSVKITGVEAWLFVAFDDVVSTDVIREAVASGILEFNDGFK